MAVLANPSKKVAHCTQVYDMWPFGPRRLNCTIVITRCPSSVVHPSSTFSFSTSLKSLNGIQRNLTGSKIWTSSTKLVFFRADRKDKIAARPLIGWYIFDFFSETAERNSTKLDKKQDLNVLYQVCVFQADRKNKMAVLASDGCKVFEFFFENAKRNSMKLDRKQDLNAFYQICVFQADE